MCYVCSSSCPTLKLKMMMTKDEKEKQVSDGDGDDNDIDDGTNHRADIQGASPRGERLGSSVTVEGSSEPSHYLGTCSER